jgi:hypothetical protein
LLTGRGPEGPLFHKGVARRVGSFDFAQDKFALRHPKDIEILKVKISTLNRKKRDLEWGTRIGIPRSKSPSFPKSGEGWGTQSNPVCV